MFQCTEKIVLLGQKAWAQTQLKISHPVYLYKCEWKSAKTFCWHKNGAYYFLLFTLKCSLLGNTAEGVYSACVSLCNTLFRSLLYAIIMHLKVTPGPTRNAKLFHRWNLTTFSNCLLPFANLILKILVASYWNVSTLSIWRYCLQKVPCHIFCSVSWRHLCLKVIIFLATRVVQKKSCIET